MSCIVRGCRSHSGNNENPGENISFHKFPKQPDDIRRRWFIATNRNEKQHKNYWKLCSKHFNPECFVDGNLLRVRLKENAVPTLNLPSKTEVVLCSPRRKDVSQQQSSLSVSALPTRLATTTMCCPRRKDVSQQQSRSSVSALPTPLATTNMCRPRRKDVSQQQSSSSVSALPTPLATTNMTSSKSMKLRCKTVEASIPMLPSCVEAMYKGRIHKLQKRIEALEILAKKRLLRLNAQKQRTRRLKKNYSNLNQRLIELLDREKLDEE